MRVVELYTTDFCPYCTAAKRLLDDHGVEYTEIDMARDPVSRAELVARTGYMTFPQIVIDGEPLGGYEQLRAAVNEGRLEKLLQT